MIINKNCFLCNSTNALTSIEERLLLEHRPLILFKLRDVGVTSPKQFICDKCWTEKILES